MSLKYVNRKFLEQNTQELWDDFKEWNIHIIAIPDKKKGSEKHTFEVIMAENFPKLITDMRHISRKLTEHEAEKYQKTIPQHIIFELQKTRQRENLERSQRRGKKLIFRGTKIIIT